MTVDATPGADRDLLPRPARGRGGRRSKGSGPQPYDFRRPTQLSREHTRTLQLVMDTFARQWTTLLTSSLRVVTQVTPVAIEQLTYAEYVETLANPTVMALMSIEPLSGTAVLEFSLANAMSSVDHLLGGPGAGDQPNRTLSDIETALLRQLLARVLRELKYALEPIVSIDPQVSALEYNPPFAQAGSPSDMVLCASFELQVGTEECIATLCLPFGSFFPSIEAANGHGAMTERERLEKVEAHQLLDERMHSVPIEVAVRFEPVGVTPATLVSLRPGDVLPLTHSLSSPLTVHVDDVTLAHAVPGAQGKRLACLIVEDPEDFTPGENRS